LLFYVDNLFRKLTVNIWFSCKKVFFWLFFDSDFSPKSCWVILSVSISGDSWNGNNKKFKQISKNKTKDCLTTIRDIDNFVSAGIGTHLYSKVWHEIITVTFSSKMNHSSTMICLKILQNIFIHLSMIWYFSRANPERLRQEQPDCLPVLPDIFVCRSSSRRSCPRRTWATSDWPRGPSWRAGCARRGRGRTWCSGSTRRGWCRRTPRPDFPIACNVCRWHKCSTAYKNRTNNIIFCIESLN